MTPNYQDLLHYGKIIADKEHETVDGHFIRFVTFEFLDKHYVATKYDGDIIMIAEKEL